MWMSPIWERKVDKVISLCCKNLGLNSKNLNLTATLINPNSKGQNEHTKRASNIPARVVERSGCTQLNLQCRLLPTAERSKKQNKKKLFRFKFSTFSLTLETFLELICYSKDIVTLILVYGEAAFSGSLLKSRGKNSVCTTPGEMLCKQTFEKWVGVKWNTALYVTHVSGNCVSVTQHWAVPMRCCCINVCVQQRLFGDLAIAQSRTYRRHKVGLTVALMWVLASRNSCLRPSVSAVTANLVQL